MHGTVGAWPVAVRFVRLSVFALAWLWASSRVAAQLPPTVSGGTRLTLDAAVNEALEKNLDLIATRAGVTIADANLITARLRRIRC